MYLQMYILLHVRIINSNNMQKELCSKQEIVLYQSKGNSSKTEKG